MSNYWLPVSESGYLTVPDYLRERHLTPGTDEAECQAIGTDLQVFIESDRDNLLIRTPLEQWHTGNPYERKFARGRIHIKRWEDLLMMKRFRGGGPHLLGHVEVIEIQP